MITFLDFKSALVYDAAPNITVSEIVNLNSVEWMPCAKRGKHYVPMDCMPKSLKRKWKPSD